MRPPRAVFFDAMGTLVRLRPPAPRLRRLLAEWHGIDVAPADVEQAFRLEIAHYRAQLMRGRDAASLAELRSECAEILRDALGLHRLSAPQMTNLLLESLHFDAYSDARPALEWVRGTGARLLVVSNWDVSLHDVLRRAALADHLDGVLASAEVGVRKPDPAIFRKALELCGCPPEEALHVGDSLEEDVAGAQAAGIPCVLVQRRGKLRQVPPSIPTLARLASVISRSR